MKTATFITILPTRATLAALYKTSDRGYIVASSCHRPEFAVEECFLFQSDSHGLLLDMEPLEGSLNGTTNHREALTAAGYEVIVE